MVDKLWFSFNKRHTIKCQEDFMKMSYRSSVNVGEARIDAGGLKLEAGTSNCMKRSSSVEFRADELRCEPRQQCEARMSAYAHSYECPSIEPY